MYKVSRVEKVTGLVLIRTNNLQDLKAREVEQAVELENQLLEELKELAPKMELQLQIDAIAQKLDCTSINWKEAGKILARNIDFPVDKTPSNNVHQ
ncbi:MAG: hypothetical protein JKY95_13580 [Planctomycetaceae bacterium]|nr:hypothetical protein [Planctomycetaceae bacterium]